MSHETDKRPKVRVAPLLPLALAASAGIVIDRYAGPCDTAGWGAIVLAAAVAGGLIGVRWPRAGVVPIVIAFLALGGGWHHYQWSDQAPADLALQSWDKPRPAWVRGQLAEVLGFRPGHGPRESGATRALLDISGLNDGSRWYPASGRVQAVVGGDRTDLVAGDTVESAGTLERIPGPLNPGEFDYRAYLRAQGVRLRLTVGDPEGVWRSGQESNHFWLLGLGRLRSWSQRRLAAGLDPKSAPLAAALLLGRREGVDPDVNDAFGRTGTTHLLAISGLHLQVLAGGLLLVFRVLGLSRRAAFASVALATIGYALLVGLMPSVTRSAAMTCTVCAAGFLNRNVRPANVLAVAALITLLLNPAHLFDVGGQLSFLAIAAIFWCARPSQGLFEYSLQAVTQRDPDNPLDALERRLEPRWRTTIRGAQAWLYEGVSISIIVWLAALPLVALRFHVASPIGILLNIPLIPVTSLALLAAGLSLGLSAVSEPLGAPCAWVCSCLLSWTESVVRWGAEQTWGHWFVAGPPWGWTLVFYGLLGLATAAWVGRWAHWRGLWCLFGGWVASGLALSLLPPRAGASLEAEVLAVGHGLAVVVQTGDGHTLLYDCGKMGEPSVGRRIVAPALWARGINRLDEVILSHADSDHYNGLPDVLERFAIGAVRVAPGFGGAKNPGAEQLLGQVKARGIAVRPIAAGDRWEWGEARFSVRHPDARWLPAASDNARSVVLDLEAHGRHALLTGDLEREGLPALEERPGPPIDVLLSPHHGGRSANPEGLYAWARPAQVVVSQRPPPSGSKDALADAVGRDTRLLRTWERGAVRLSWTKERLLAQGYLDERRSHGAAMPVLANMSVATFGLTWPRALVGVLGFLIGLAACGALLVVEWGAWTLVLPRRKLGSHDEDEGPGEPIEALAADGVRLAGLWHPAATAAQGTVLLLHGFAEPTSLRGRIEALNRRGWNVASLDSRGHGRSGGVHTTFGGREAGDVRSWIDALAGRLGPSSCVAAWGRSMGAAVVMRAAADDPRIATVVLEAPYVDLEAAIATVLRRFHIPLSRLFASLIAHRAERLAGVSLTRPRPIDIAPRISARALVVHGAIDTLVPLAEAQRLAEALPGPATLVDVPGAGHINVVDVGGDELLARIAVFLDESHRGWGAG
ncbi:MAG: DNA internalization-related competence protein ComEC/Rec2 [Isosphaeraceae bacterium]|nr:DNA internalization-related competence protein ComEC/Rec2 [Isosphaeraceae bacterium]